MQIVSVSITALRGHVRPDLQHEAVVQQLCAVLLRLRPETGYRVVPEGLRVLGVRRLRVVGGVFITGSVDGAVVDGLLRLLVRGGACVAGFSSHRSRFFVIAVAVAVVLFL